MKKLLYLYAALLGIAIFSMGVQVSGPPPGAIGPYLDGVFPSRAPSQGGSWGLEEVWPDRNYDSPVRIIQYAHSEDLLILNKSGKLYQTSTTSDDNKLLLDLSDQVFNLGEGGAVGLALHPNFGDPSFPEKQLLFLFYRTTPMPSTWSENGFNRLSKFSWDPINDVFDPASEEILIQHYDRKEWHNGGGMFFGPDGFLYLTLGDEGYEDFLEDATQKIDGGLFSGIIRIDVDNDPTRSHPIIRQPIPSVPAPSGWGETYTQGYSIPNDNPWLSASGDHLEEFFAIGLRSPFGMTYDQDSDQILVSDVGSDVREEISIVKKGDNLQWPYKEGLVDMPEFPRPDLLLGEQTPPIFEYDRSIGSCIIGGEVYRGTAFPELNGKFLFGDFTFRKLMALSLNGGQQEPEMDVLIGDFNNLGLTIPQDPGITDIKTLRNGEILISIMGDFGKIPGKVYRLVRYADVAEPPAKLSELGAFTDLQNLIPGAGLIPYKVNAPLWSDRASKKRWIAIPNEGGYGEERSKIEFDRNNPWKFPEGTVFVKHFDLPTAIGGMDKVPLETRFFIMGENGTGYGLTYKWNEQGTDAILLGGADVDQFEIEEEDGSIFMQTWEFPSRDQCISCHNPNAGYVLGFNTHQLNGDLDYPQQGITQNQLQYLSNLGVFDQRLGYIDDLPRATEIDDENASLESRIRSYLDANCASCHRPGGIQNINIDLRFNTPLHLTNTINIPTQSRESDQDRLIIRPGDHRESEFWVRDASQEQNQMPPLGRTMVDENYVEDLAEWIDQLTDQAGSIADHHFFPNPTQGSVNIYFPDNWQPPYRVMVRAVNGRLLYETNASDQHLFMDLRHFAAGLYTVEIYYEDQRKTTQLIIN